MITRQQPAVAYFSMEVGLASHIPTYAGGLGVLAGDTLRTAADLGMPMVGVTLAYRSGYFRQHLDAAGNQTESPAVWSPADEGLEEVGSRVTVRVCGRDVRVRAWSYVIRSPVGGRVPVYLLDTDLPENAAEDRALTGALYGGDAAYRLAQEAVLGFGGIALLRALGYEQIVAHHMNEGHSSLLALALLDEVTGGRGGRTATIDDIERVRARCVFTTHTPIPAGHDQFPIELAQRVLGPEITSVLAITGCCPADTLNMTHLALRFSRYVNGVAVRHGEISRGLFPGQSIDSITNGVHAATWTALPFQELFDRHGANWRRDNFNLRYATSIPVHQIREAHAVAKAALLDDVAALTGERLDPTRFTIGFARRATRYKRPELLFCDLDRLRHIAATAGPLQIIYAGKAHPLDEDGKAAIRHIFAAADLLRGAIPIVYLENYEMALARSICAGVDLWLNTPEPPNEASGTSGMKAALNGVPSLSVLDGWWIEGHVEGVTGWAIRDGTGTANPAALEAQSIYEQLESVILPMFYERPEDYGRVMRNAIALNGSFFNGQRMLLEYAADAYGMQVQVTAPHASRTGETA
ncbi:MAG: alpha-glucan family phosphorylase [Dehalococcoidia bacterium]